MPSGDREPIPLAYEPPTPANVVKPWVIVAAIVVWLGSLAAIALGTSRLWHDFADPDGGLALLLIGCGVGTSRLEWLVLSQRSAVAASIVAVPCAVVLFSGGLLALVIVFQPPHALGISRWHAIFPFAASVLRVAVMGVHDRWTRKT